MDRSKNAAAIDAADRVVRRIWSLGFTNRGVKNGNRLYVLRNTTAPAILVECCFCDNMLDRDIYKKVGADQMGYAIACGILDVKEIKQADGENPAPAPADPGEQTEKQAGETTPKAQEGTYLVKVSISTLRIRKGPGTGFDIVKYINPGIYTIVETQGNWGRLKSGAGWICLDYTKRV
jgi:hypothetical protein